ncbi:MAG: O-antigen ligase family protein [Pseudomonadales bacterium]|nr:O-antigen ligase family protein [Pseudomonadales bacterium]MDG1442225.1 O-antigen ligase family protein [Pseudomonadales bacterium]
MNLPGFNWRSIKLGYSINAVLFLTALTIMLLRQSIIDATPDLATGQATIIEALLYASVFALTLTFLKDKKSIQTLIYAVVGIGLFQAFLGSYWVIVGTQGRASGTFINPNHLAGFLEMSIGLGVGMMLSIHSTKGTTFRTSLISWSELLLGPKARLRVVLIIMVIAVVMSASRSGNTALFSSIFITAITMLIIARKLNRSTIILLVSLVVIDVALIGTYFGVERVANRIQQTTLAKEQRDEVSVYTVEIIKDNLLWGTGAGTFEHVFPKYRGSDVGAHFTHAENDYLQFLSELGLTGFMPLSLIVLLSYGAAVQALRVRKSQFYRGIAFGTLMAMNSILIHSFTDFNLRIPVNACLFMVVLALGWVSLYSERGGTNSRGARRSGT